MEAIAPFSKVLEFGAELNGFIAIALGMGFGFFLERAGFGDSRVLAGQWYGYNFAVLRVMFTAIVVSMVGVFGLNAIGLLNFDLVYINTTYLWPQIVGGVIFGVGFNIGQYCPGTSIVACATGKIDGLFYLGGFFAGIIAFSFAFPWLEDFFNSSSMGRAMLTDIIDVPVGVIVFGVTLMALGAFALTHFLDKKLGNVGASK